MILRKQKTLVKPNRLYIPHLRTTNTTTMFQKTIFLLFCLCSLHQTSHAQVKKTATDWFYDGKVLCDQGNLEAALYAFNQAIVLSPEFAGAYNNRGAVKGALNNHEGAVEDFKKSISLGVPISCVTWFNLGYSLEQLGRCSEAYEAYLKAKEQIGLRIDNVDKNININEAIARMLNRCKA